jgi:hypothetical protein
MKQLLFTFALGLALAACSKEAAVSSAPPAEKDSSAKPYPLTTCVVSGEKLGGMGDPFIFMHEGTEVRLCCKSCKEDFDAEPAKFMAKLK